MDFAAPIAIAAILVFTFTKDLDGQSKKEQKPDENNRPKIVVVYDKG